MINKTNKGRRIELLARKELEADGWLVEKKNNTKWQSPDFWGVFDLIAIKENNVKFIQVKSNIGDFYKGRKKTKAWIKENNFKIPTEVWLYEGRSKWRKEIINEL